MSSSLASKALILGVDTLLQSPVPFTEYWVSLLASTFLSGRIDELQFDSDSSQLKLCLNERQHHSKSRYRSESQIILIIPPQFHISMVIYVSYHLISAGCMSGRVQELQAEKAECERQGLRQQLLWPRGDHASLRTHRGAPVGLQAHPTRGAKTCQDVAKTKDSITSSKKRSI